MWLLTLSLLLAAQSPRVDPYGLHASPHGGPAGPLAVVVVAPVFPPDLPASPEAATAAFDVEMDHEGRVRKVTTVECGAPSACRSAQQALRTWRFQAGPATVKATFVFRTMPRGTPPEGLTTIVRNKYEVEVRRIAPDNAIPEPDDERDDARTEDGQ